MADSGREVCPHRGDCGRGRPARPRLRRESQREDQPLEDAPEPPDPPPLRHLFLRAALHLRQHVLAAQHRQADPGDHDLSVGFLSAIPWVCAVIAMYFAAKWQDKAKSKRPLLVAALLVAAVGTLAA